MPIFYYPSLKKEEKEHFLSGLSAEEKSYVQRMECTEGKIYYPLDNEICTFLLDITARGVAVLLFLFYKEQGVLWGNYQMAFPLFL